MTDMLTRRSYGYMPPSVARMRVAHTLLLRSLDLIRQQSDVIVPDIDDMVFSSIKALASCLDARTVLKMAEVIVDYVTCSGPLYIQPLGAADSILKVFNDKFADILDAPNCPETMTKAISCMQENVSAYPLYLFFPWKKNNNCNLLQQRQQIKVIALCCTVHWSSMVYNVVFEAIDFPRFP